jgi:folate-binding protein YgfZ
MTELDALARDAAVVVAARSRETLLVTGPDRGSWLQGLVTCDVKALPPGSGTWGLVLNRQGKIQSDVWVVASPEAYCLAFAPGTGAAMENELERMLIMEDAELAVPPAPHSWFMLHGPQALARATRWAELAGGAAAGIDWTGLGGAALVVPGEREGVVVEQAGSALLGAEDWARLRLERGLPEFGTDFDGRDRPHEAALDRRAVNWSKGCYLGQEVVCMQDMRGKVKRSLRVLHIAAPRAAALEVGAVVARPDGQSAGTLTSFAYSPRADGWLAMARVQLDALDGELHVADAAGASHHARVADPL